MVEGGPGIGREAETGSTIPNEVGAVAVRVSVLRRLRNTCMISSSR